MDFNFGTIYMQHHHHHHFSDHPIIDEQEKQRIRYEVLRELEKEKIRNEILAGELERRRVLETEVRRELGLVLGHPMLTDRYRFEPERFASERRTVYDDGGLHDVGGFEPVPVQRSLSSNQLTIKSIVVKQSNTDKKEMIGLGHPSSSKRRAPTPSKRGGFSCKDCKIIVTSARALGEHLCGRKHLVKIGMKPRSKKTKKKKKKKGCKTGKKHLKAC